jgi:uncharacterized protein YbjQ (UPF0145 family)
VTRIRTFLIIGLLYVILGAGTAAADNEMLLQPVEPAMKAALANKKVDGSVKFYLAGASHPQTLKEFGEFVAKPKTNAFAKNKTETCNYAFLDALLTLQRRAKALGGNAVVGIKSFYQDHALADDTQFECHVGALIAGAALKGTVVRIAE